MDKKSQTIETYNLSAKSLAKKFDDIGARVLDIEETFILQKKENPNILEIGCGNGRDAEKIIEKTDKYLGVDISEELIKLAKEKVPQAHFEVADITNFKFPNNLDIVFAFASLIHVSKEEFKTILGRIHEVINKDGVVRVSLKYSDEYKEVTQKDEFGTRTYYFYSENDIKELAKDFTIVKLQVLQNKEVKWLEIILRKE